MMQRMTQAFRDHWPEYLIEAAGLGTFMVAAGLMATFLYSPVSPAAPWIPAGLLRDGLMGLAMGLTAIAIIYSPWGKRSGAHINPAFTLAFFHLRKISRWDALFYVLFQFSGGTLGVILVATLLGNLFTDPPVNYVVTLPGRWGWGAAFIAEFLLAFSLMMMVLVTTNSPPLAMWTGVFAGLMVALYITFESPISGMSINPARTFASGFPARIWDHFWIYYSAPPLGTLAAAEFYVRAFGHRPTLCSKLCPNSETPCICSNCCQAARCSMPNPTTSSSSVS